MGSMGMQWVPWDAMGSMGNPLHPHGTTVINQLVIELNSLIGKRLSIGNVEIIGHDLCRPCKHLEEMLQGEDIIKEFLRRGGLRCEILNSGIVTIGDEIKVV